MSPEQPSAMNWAATPAAAPRTYQDAPGARDVPGADDAGADPARADARVARAGRRVRHRGHDPGARRGGRRSDRVGPHAGDARDRRGAVAGPRVRAGERGRDPVRSTATSMCSTCQQGLQFFPDRRAGLAEMRRIVRPGGQVVVATWCDPSQSGFAVIARVLTRHLGESVEHHARAVRDQPGGRSAWPARGGRPVADRRGARDDRRGALRRPRRVRDQGDDGGADGRATDGAERGDPRGARGRHHRRAGAHAPGERAGVPLLLYAIGIGGAPDCVWKALHARPSRGAARHRSHSKEADGCPADAIHPPRRARPDDASPREAVEPLIQRNPG